MKSMPYPTHDPLRLDASNRRRLCQAKLPAGMLGLLLLTLAVGCGKADRLPATRVDVGAGSIRQSPPTGLAEHANLPRESYEGLRENRFQLTQETALSTFAMDVDTASFTNVRRMLREGRRPPPAAVRLEEFVNYFSYDYPAPAADASEDVLSPSLEMSTCPWNDANYLLRVAVQGRPADLVARPRCNLVFLVDASGSMVQHNKLPWAVAGLRMLARNLNADDTIAIVTYAANVGLLLPPTPANDLDLIEAALDSLVGGGGTNGAGGLQAAYQLAEQNFAPEGINRVILCTDGDFNIGPRDPEALLELIRSTAQRGVYLSVLGFGSDNLQDAMLEEITNAGNGNYSYVDSLLEARRVLVEQVGGTLQTIARDAKIQVEFDASQVQSFRLLGYRNRLLNDEDFLDDSKDAGEIGAGHSVTAFYEIVPNPEPANAAEVGAGEESNSGVRDSQERTPAVTARIRYALPGSGQVIQQVALLPHLQGGRGSQEFQFATAVAGAAMLLSGSEYAGSMDWSWVENQARDAIGNRHVEQREGFVDFVRMASDVASLD